MKFTDETEEETSSVKKHPDYDRNLKRAVAMCSPPDDRIYTFKIVICSSQWGYEDLVSINHKTKGGKAYANPISLHQEHKGFSRTFFDMIYNCIRCYIEENEKIGRTNAHLDDEAQTDDSNAWFIKICWVFAKIKLTCKKIGKSVAEFEAEYFGKKRDIPKTDCFVFRNV